ncbi:MAG: hypothetical protein LW847_05095 [Burkholderiales bacterium]|jgi:hypothetical protein|nr:hypothetical protein [Burkholderiales bacterium]
MPFSQLLMWVAGLLVVVGVFLCMRAVALRRPQPLRVIAAAWGAAAALALTVAGSALDTVWAALLLAVVVGALLTWILSKPAQRRA